MIERLDLVQKQYDEIGNQLMDPEIVNDMNRYKAISKQRKQLEPIVKAYQEYQGLLRDVNDAKELLHDPEMAEMAQMELEEKEPKLAPLEEHLKALLLPKDPNDEKDVIIEIRGAAGGDEANIFAGDLYRMYQHYIQAKGWKMEVLDAQEGAAGGFAQIQFSVSGENVYSFLKYESGAHRVQRIPVTEANGRIQTSTATVLVMPEADELDFKLDMSEIRVDIFCASGPGGQGVNTTYSAVRVTHLPTGIQVQCQDGRSQHENKASALKVLSAKLYERALEEQEEKNEALRMSKIGHGDRSEKIRTYNYPQNRVTDHRIGFTISQLDRVMEGKLDAVIDALIAEDERRRLADEAGV